MSITTVVGPLATEAEAQATADYLGREAHSVYSRAIKDADGFDTDERQWFVERDDSPMPARLFGMTWGQIQAKQQRN